MNLAQSDVGRALQCPRYGTSYTRGHVLGLPLVMAREDLRAYLEAAARFRTAAADVFGHEEPQARVETLLGTLTGGRPIRLPMAEDGRAYLPVTLRWMREGDRRPPHAENGASASPAMRRLNPGLDQKTMLSFYVTLAVPASGGELHIHASGNSPRTSHIDTVLWPAAGDLLVFDSGRHVHEVTPVQGGDRWTMGGFFAFSRDHQHLQFWS